MPGQDHGRIKGEGGTGGRLPLFEQREYFEILIITECFFNSQPSQNKVNLLYLN